MIGTLPQCVVLGAIFAVSRLSFGSDTEESEKRAVVDAWKERQDHVRSFEFTWSGKELVPSMRAAHDAQKSNGPLLTPFDLRYSLVSDQRNRIRFESFGTEWDGERSVYAPTHAIRTFDGRVLRIVSPDSSNGAGFPVVSVLNADATKAARNVWFLPFQLAYRAFDADIGVFQPTTIQIAEQRAVVAGDECSIVTQSKPGDVVESVWVDRSKGFMPVRYEKNIRGVLRRQITILIAPDPIAGWAPISWKIVVMSDAQRLLTSTWGDVVTHRLNNDVPDSVFEAPVPANAWVNDGVAKETYITRPNGEKRPVVDGEFDGKNFDYLLTHDPPGIFSTGRVLGLAASVLAVAIAVRCYRVRRRLASNKQS
jgi:hypothetical protein